ncbi:DNA-binding transcriptional LysR family regulator [Cricetibacter osteomyelitidis]|uniref:DNA-binding transcriptional LysR family regulator n=1 Tax=Cricetibacter osteomyelitidis TaxID=1521931 RepID=A0A4R2SZK4_9PAST|nr:LysR family transcriptional regulator [Cricetibacter osteomyelitidis]TCP90088.1 DNA-binding transcriptional LysR family regulator [Cricetibacter osteomyelitidis]
MTPLNAILIFNKVVEKGNLSAVARELGISASAVSQHLRQLEQHYGIKLLNRTTRRISLTEQGNLLWQGTKQLQAILDDTHRRLEQQQTEVSGIVTISLPSGFIESAAMQGFIYEIGQRYPHIELHLLPEDEVIDLFNSEVDIAIRAVEPLPDSPLIAHYLALWGLGIYASPDYLALHSIRSLHDLPQQHWICNLDNLFQRLFGYLNLGEFQPKRRLQCPNILAARRLAAMGQGLTLQLSGEVAHYIERGELVQVLPEQPLPQYNLYALTTHRTQSAKMAKVLGLLQENFR